MTDTLTQNPPNEPIGPASVLTYSDQHAELGVVRDVVEVFRVGTYRYTSLADDLPPVGSLDLM